MTLIIGWIAFDQNSASSAYLMSDSRYTYGNVCTERFDFGSKLLALDKSPDIFGFCGDAASMLSFMSSLRAEDSGGFLFPDGSGSAERSKIVLQKMESSFADPPALTQSCLYHVSLDLLSGFHFYRYSFLSHYGDIRHEEIRIRSNEKAVSSLVFSDGSGCSDFNKNYACYQHGISANTSRGFYQAFIRTMCEPTIETFGGHPQLVCLRRGTQKGLGAGIVYRGSLYFLGEEVQANSSSASFNKVDWYNEKFEKCDPFTKRREIGAQIQPDPLNK